ncbi:MAG: V-type ATPase subunit, partial [Vallitaleaceae bacterium]|nr:V-type ATPase subunit [Vallitaleaceae bacterium]
MITMFKYSHLSAKISAMKGKMLSEDDYLAMISKKNVLEVATYLKNETYYSTAFQTLNEKDVHRDYLEVMLVRAEITDALKIAKYLTGKDKKIYRYVYRKQEIEDLKKMLRTLQMGKRLTDIDRKTLFISKYSKIDFNETLRARNITELVESIRGTKFYGILKPLILEENKIDLFSAEMALDM